MSSLIQGFNLSPVVVPNRYYRSDAGTIEL